MSRRTKVLIGLTVTTVLVVGLLLFFQPGTSPPSSFPNPNGYIYLVNAGTMLKPRPDDYRKLSETRLRMYVNENTEALQQARMGLNYDSQVTTEYSQTYFSGHITELASIKSLALAFAAEGRLSELEHRPGDALQSYLDTIRLGQKASQGGVMIDRLVGLACETIGQKSLQPFIPTLAAPDCRAALSALTRIDADTESTDAILARERKWCRLSLGWRGLVASAFQINSRQKRDRDFLAQNDGNQRRRRRLMIELALRAHELEKGTRPTNLNELVPYYLKAIPQDPGTGSNLVY
jgi:hypothetical protein